MKKFFIYFLALLSLLSLALAANANGLPDADRDGVPDKDEVEIYFTNPSNRDTDGDGFTDFAEINAGYSPTNPASVKLVDSDLDQDGLSDAWEIKFRTDPRNPDTDGDGHKDGEEVDAGYDPALGSDARLTGSLRVNLHNQTLDFLLNGYAWKTFSISSGKPSMPTPKGEFTIANKIEKAWSRAYGLWMPYWMGISGTRAGFHELPIWPNGYREGEDHLGKAVSHGCVRLGVGAAEYLYDRISVGDQIIIR